MSAVRQLIEDVMKAKHHTIYHYVLRDIVVLIIIAALVRTFGFGLYHVPTGSMETTMLVGERFLADKLTPFFFIPQRGDIVIFNDPLYEYSSNPLTYFFQQYISGPSQWTKRVIGIPGDRVKGVIEHGKTALYVNGKKLDESYINNYPLVPVADHDNHAWRSYDPTASFDKQPFYHLNKDAVRQAQHFFEQEHVRTILYPGSPLPEDWGNDLFDVQLEDSEYWVMGDNRLGSSDSRNWGPLNGNLIHGKVVACLFSVDSISAWLFADLILHPIDFCKRIRWNRCLRWVC